MAELLVDFRMPQLNCLTMKKPFGALKEVTLPAIHEEFAAPYTTTSAWYLLKAVGKAVKVGSLAYGWLQNH